MKSVTENYFDCFQQPVRRERDWWTSLRNEGFMVYFNGSISRLTFPPPNRHLVDFFSARWLDLTKWISSFGEVSYMCFLNSGRDKKIHSLVFDASNTFYTFSGNALLFAPYTTNSVCTSVLTCTVSSPGWMNSLRLRSLESTLWIILTALFWDINSGFMLLMYVLSHTSYYRIPL